MYRIPISPTFAGEVSVWHHQLKEKGLKFGGVWLFARPVLVLTDPEYIKDVLTKDFNHFTDRDVYVNENHDPRGTHLFNTRSDKWRALRQKLTPTFTTGNMKIMFGSVLKCSNNMIEFVDEYAKRGEDVDIKEVLASFTSDVIFCVAFGVDCNTFKDTHPEFREQRLEIFRFRLKLIPKLLTIMIFPELARKLRIKSQKEITKQFFGNVVKSAMEYRSKNNIRRPDFLQLLIDINQNSKDEKKHITFDEIVANTILFFVAGFDTSSNLMHLTLYELAKNQELQEKTRKEINNVLKNHNGELTYEALQDMTYLMQAMDETMRLYPPLIGLARVCTKDYKLRDTDIVIEKGTAVAISPLGLGRDPEFFPDPEKYDPERFSQKNRRKFHPYAHIPFGEGPRQCIGLRFGIMQSKIGLIRLLTNYKFTISPKTKLPLTIDPARFLLETRETLYLKAEKIV